ncbi:uncharacterized protein EI90DRAFT_3073317 [Cantharellus anzutake]|uniref:uncharacterized protein n=1 Tax=Cantharellus anzutake TaxID=1750568 RepID=UPI0019083367|nr:uncharacterized protein EI90DRAFT_3073317 [Cantharellus anzutake]KAF8325201.1 hypothetical protein EI90DRAFT_3073317 [Cantharellus anzutake]
MTVTSTITVPPGLPAEINITRLIVDGGAHDREWDTYDEVRRYTNAFVWDEKHAKPGESPLDAAKRELKEEAVIEAPLVHAAILFFKSSSLNYAHHIDVFRANTWDGTPSETEEMRPEWFSTNLDRSSSSPSTSTSNPSAVPTPTPNTSPETSLLPGVPYDQMWADDRIWLPLLLAKTPFIGRVDFGELNDKTGEEAISEPMVKWWFASVDGL